MKISGKFILKVAGTLTVISLVVALLLGLVNGVTKDKIAAIEATYGADAFSGDGLMLKKGKKVFHRVVIG